MAGDKLCKFDTLENLWINYYDYYKSIVSCITDWAKRIKNGDKPQKMLPKQDIKIKLTNKSCRWEDSFIYNMQFQL